jgi:hypothetical protein
MFCLESIRLESIYRQRYERARGGPMITLQSNSYNHILMVRQHRAQLAQAANSILMHQRNCSVCRSDERMPGILAS